MDDPEVTPTDLLTLFEMYFAGSVTVDQAADAIASHIRQVRQAEAPLARDMSLEEAEALLREFKARDDARIPPDVILDIGSDNPERKRALDLLNKALNKRLDEPAS